MVFDRVMQNNRRIAGHTGRVPRYVHAFGYVLIATVMGASFLHAETKATNEVRSPVENIAALASGALMLTVSEGPFIMGTALLVWEKPMSELLEAAED